MRILRGEGGPLPALEVANRLIQVVTNLVSNAHKYTPAGGTITLSAVVARNRSQKTGQLVPPVLHIRVTDTGIGMSEDDLVEAVVGLGPNLFYGTTIAVNILVLAKNKTDTRTQFIDASGLFRKETNNNVLLDTHIDRIVAVFDRSA